MSTPFPDLYIRRIGEGEDLPYELLLLADPSQSAIEAYIRNSEVYLAFLDTRLMGVFVLFPLSANSVEIKNLAVSPELQGRGLGSLLLDHAIEIAAGKGFASICIGTANSSIGQLYLYQKKGFEISEVIRNFFLDNYEEPIYENGIQAKHLLMLKRELKGEGKI